MLDEGQQLLPAALFGQDLEDVGEAWDRGGACGGGQSWEAGAQQMASPDLVTCPSP